MPKYKSNPPGSSSGDLHGRENKQDYILNISTPNRHTDRGRYEKSPGTAPSTYDTAERLQPIVGK